MNKDNWEGYRTLQNAGWNVQKHNQVRFNSGSETIKHAVAKMLVAQAGARNGYRVSSEVDHSHRGEIDILLWGNPDRLTLAVECETSPTDDVIEDKVDRYVRDTPIDDLVLVNVTELPTDMLDAYAEIMEVLGLGPQ
jgi:hypothetical protein